MKHSLLVLNILMSLMIASRLPLRVHSQSDGNIHVLKAEIGRALAGCGGASTDQRARRDDFETRAATAAVDAAGRKRRRAGVERDKNRAFEAASDDEDFNNGRDFDEEQERSGNRRGDSPWEDPRDDGRRLDGSSYAHDRRYVPSSRNPSNNSTSMAKQHRQQQQQHQITSDWDFDDHYGHQDGHRDGGGQVDLGRGPSYKSVRELNRSHGDGVGSLRRRKRFGKAQAKADDQCLSQCVFANLQIIDDKGIPKEALFMKLVEDNITSQQSRIIIMNLIQDCFKELASESEENECSYSNSLERCMNLQLKKRKTLLNEESSHA